MPLLIAAISALFAVLGLFRTNGTSDGGDAGQAPAEGTNNAGDGAGAGSGAAGDGAAGAGTATPPQGDGQAPAQEGTKLTDPTELQRALDHARAQAASERTKRTTAEAERTKALEAFKPIAKLLGLDTGDEPDPAALQSKLEQTQAELRAERVNSAFLRVASQVGANPELTLRYLRGGNELNGLDPADAAFETSLKTIVQAAIDSTPALKAAAPQAGGSFDGGARGAQAPAEPDTLAGLVAERINQQRRMQA